VHCFWGLVTGLGDAAAMVPLAGTVLLWLAVNRLPRKALLWCALQALGALVVLTTKVAFLGWGLGIRAIDFTGVSGHATLACAIIPVAAYLACRSCGRKVRHGAIGLGFACGLLVGLSRVALGVHSSSEAIIGCALGSATAVACLLLGRIAPGSSYRAWPLWAGFAVALIVALCGIRAPTEIVITQISHHLSRLSRSL
jgi:membrane-associated phospholipid phosphatase